MVQGKGLLQPIPWARFKQLLGFQMHLGYQHTNASIVQEMSSLKSLVWMLSAHSQKQWLLKNQLKLLLAAGKRKRSVDHRVWAISLRKQRQQISTGNCSQEPFHH